MMGRHETRRDFKYCALDGTSKFPVFLDHFPAGSFLGKNDVMVQFMAS